MNKEIYSGRTVLRYLSLAALLPLGQSLDPENREKVESMHELFSLFLLKRTSLYINP